MDLNLYAKVKPTDVIEGVNIFLTRSDTAMGTKQDLMDAIAAEKAQAQALIDENSRLKAENEALKARNAELEAGSAADYDEAIAAAKDIIPG